MKILVLCSPQIQAGSEEKFWHTDKQVIAEIKKAGHETDSMLFYKEKEIDFEGYEMVFNLCDGFEDVKDEAIVPDMLSAAGRLYTGCPASAIALCANKVNMKALLVQHGVPTPEYQVFETGDEELKLHLDSPLIVKPVVGHASTGIEDENVVHDEESMRKILKSVIKSCKCPAFAERYIPSREFCVPMTGNGEFEMLPLFEVNYRSFPEGAPKILSYKAKWSKRSDVYKNTESFVAENIGRELKAKIEAAAKNAVKAIGCRGYATADVRADGNDVYVIDINPNPYLGIESDFVRAAAIAGMDHSMILDRIIRLALQK